MLEPNRLKPVSAKLSFLYIKKNGSCVVMKLKSNLSKLYKLSQRSFYELVDIVDLWEDFTCLVDVSIIDVKEFKC